MDSSKVEGWTWLTNSRKWHYFRDRKSLCGKFGLFVHPREGYEISGGTSVDNCAKCVVKLGNE